MVAWFLLFGAGHVSWPSNLIVFLALSLPLSVAGRDDVSVDGIGTSINADGGMELGEAGPRTGYSPQRNGHSPQRNGPHRGLSSTSSPPRFSHGGAAGSPATPPEQLTKSGSIGGGSSASASARKQPSAASRPSPQVPLQGGGPRQRGGSAEGDLISLDSPMPQPITSPPMQVRSYTSHTSHKYTTSWRTDACHGAWPCGKCMKSC